MTAERWRQVKKVFNAACECEPERRSAFLDELCAGDAELRREVESLLAAHEESGEFMRRPLAPALLAEITDTAPTADLESGRQIGPYQVVRRLGAGGAGVVYLARDTRLGRPVALKLLKGRYTQDDERVRRFQREARAISALNHPNILTIYEFGQDSGLRFLATEFVDGQTLRERFRNGRTSLGEALDLLVQVAGALEAAHEAGVVHRDLKPENIMARRDRIVKVLDFGLAKLTEPAVQPFGDELPKTRTRPGVVMGTVNYMSPEQARGEEVDARSDLFSLGVVMYEMLTGHAPFAAATVVGVIASLIEDEPPPLSHYIHNLPAALQNIADRALAKSVDRRYQTAREMGDDLKRLKYELEFAARSPAQIARHEDVIAMRVGGAPQSAANYSTRIDDPHTDDYATRDSLKAARRATARMDALAGYLRRRGKALLLALAALALLVAGIAPLRRGLSPQSAAVNSIAVLPFANVGNDPQVERLPDGITESLIGNLSRLPDLRVMARNTVFAYKGREIDPRRVGDDLNVRAVVTGRVRRQGAWLFVSAELADAATGVRLWGEEYESPLADLPSVEREIAREISEDLRPRLNDAERRRIARRRPTNSEAYRLYLLGRLSSSQYTIEGNRKALDYFNQAVALDPNYALAHAGISNVYAAISSQLSPSAEAMQKARQAALKAMELDETLPEARYALGTVRMLGDWDWAGAEREYKRAIELNPGFVLARAEYSNLLAEQGRFEEALSEAGLALESDPLSFQANYAIGKVFFLARRYDESLPYFRRMAEIAPNNSLARFCLGRVFSQQGKHQEAVGELRGALESNRSHAYRAWLAHAYALAGRRKEALKLLREMEELSRREWVPPVCIAIIHSGLDDRDQALAWLRKAYDEHSDHTLSIGVDPAFDPIRSDPRFVEILRGVGLPPQS